VSYCDVTRYYMHGARHDHYLMVYIQLRLHHCGGVRSYYDTYTSTSI
jgi:hypothetical protein